MYKRMLEALNNALKEAKSLEMEEEVTVLTEKREELKEAVCVNQACKEGRAFLKITPAFKARADKHKQEVEAKILDFLQEFYEFGDSEN